jgi:hypothetical protein
VREVDIMSCVGFVAAGNRGEIAVVLCVLVITVSLELLNVSLSFPSCIETPPAVSTAFDCDIDKSKEGDKRPEDDRSLSNFGISVETTTTMLGAVVALN